MQTRTALLAADIAALINATPRSPTLREIEAVVDMHVKPEPPVEAKVITYAEFHALMKARGKHCDLAARETRPDDVVVLWVDPIAVFMERKEVRRANGMLEKPPRLYVVAFDAEWDATRLHAVSPWRALEVFAPRHMQEVWRAAGAVRAETQTRHESRARTLSRKKSLPFPCSQP